MGQPDNPDAGSAISDLRGKFNLKNGVIKFDRLTFSVPGAVIKLNGTYKLRGEDLDFTGRVADGGQTFAIGERQEVFFPESH